MNVNAVEKRAGDALLVFGNDSRGTCTGFLWARKPTAWAGIHCRNQSKISGKCERAFGAADGDNFIIHQLAHHCLHQMKHKIKSPCQKSDRAKNFLHSYAACGCKTGLNLYPYTIIPRSSPSFLILRVTISTGMPISIGWSPKSVNCAVIIGPSSSFTKATV